MSEWEGTVGKRNNSKDIGGERKGKRDRKEKEGEWKKRGREREGRQRRGAKEIGWMERV